MSSREGAENARVLRRPVVDLHYVVQGRLEEGELAEDNCKRAFRASVTTVSGLKRLEE